MFGDFNANPFDGEVCGTAGLYAVRDRNETRQERASPLVGLGETQRPLYNPMWSLLPEGIGRPGGTCVYAPELMLRWRLYDQVLVSPDLIDALRGPPQILTKIGGERLLNANGNLDESVSDHLPVQICVMI